MDQFFTSLPPKRQSPSISYASQVFLMGSCFVENIGERLTYHKFQKEINPFGIIFHPQAILTILSRVAAQKKYTEKDIFFYNEQWHCFEVHSQLSHPDKQILLSELNRVLETTYESLSTASHLVLTYGTAWGYEKDKAIVANCHKIPQKEFNKKLSTVSELETCMTASFKLLQQLNPTAIIIATVSPVRHIKDGIVENNQSKAHLIAALHSVLKNSEKVYYYPAYELVLDCLREYRFYKADLVHPNEIAIDYIWQHFQENWLYDFDTQTTIKQVAEIQRGLQHRPFNANSEAHKKFRASLQEKIRGLTAEFPFMEF